MIFHMHQYGPVERDGYQYCKKCGQARAIPCNHQWEEKESYSVENGYGKWTANIYILRCSKCGEMKKKRINARED